MNLEEKLTPLVRSFISEVTSIIVQDTKDGFVEALDKEFGWGRPDPLQAARKKLAKMRADKTKNSQTKPAKLEQTLSPAQKDRFIKKIAAERGISELSVRKSWHRISKKL